MPTCEHPYDLLLLTFTSTAGIYARRLEAFATYGLLNIRRRKVRHIMLHSGPPIDPALLERWPCDYQIVQHETDKVNVKISGYFAEHGRELLDRARWIAKWDDDSVTDIDGLLTNLDAEFDHNDALYLMADEIAETDDPIRQALAAMGYHRWIRRSPHHKFHLRHEWEGSIFTNACLRRICDCPDAMRFLRLCTTIARDSFGDQSLAIAARMAKVHLIDAPFMTSEAA